MFRRRNLDCYTFYPFAAGMGQGIVDDGADVGWEHGGSRYNDCVTFNLPGFCELTEQMKELLVGCYGHGDAHVFGVEGLRMDHCSYGPEQDVVVDPTGSFQGAKHLEDVYDAMR